MSDCAYIFLDESGNFDFESPETRYFVMTSVSMYRPFPVCEALDSCKHDFLENGLDIEYFHCSPDKSHVRERVMGLIEDHLEEMRIDSLIVEKRKTPPALREEKRFYLEILVRLLKDVLPEERALDARQIVVITDTVPVRKNRKAFEKVIKDALAENLEKGARYRILHHSSRSHYGLQVADYCCWAVFRKWQRGETAHYDRIKGAVRNELRIFRNGRNGR